MYIPGAGGWGGREGRRVPVPSLCLSHAFSTAVCPCQPSAHTPSPSRRRLDVVLFFIGLPSSLSPLCSHLPPTVVSCSFLGFCTTQLVHTVYTQPAKRKPNGKHFIDFLEWLCPAASGWPWGGRPWEAGPGEAWAEGPGTEGGFSEVPLGGSWAGVIVFIMSCCVTNSHPNI